MIKPSMAEMHRLIESFELGATDWQRSVMVQILDDAIPTDLKYPEAIETTCTEE